MNGSSSPSPPAFPPAREVDAFGVEDVTGLPWIEIDFMEDVAKAEADVLPQLEAMPE